MTFITEKDGLKVEEFRDKASARGQQGLPDLEALHRPHRRREVAGAGAEPGDPAGLPASDPAPRCRRRPDRSRVARDYAPADAHRSDRALAPMRRVLRWAASRRRRDDPAAALQVVLREVFDALHRRRGADALHAHLRRSSSLCLTWSRRARTSGMEESLQLLPGGVVRAVQDRERRHRRRRLRRRGGSVVVAVRQQSATMRPRRSAFPTRSFSAAFVGFS